MNVSIKNKLLDIVYPTNYAFAHCDIPCGIYDPHTAQLDALTVVRMNQLIADLGDDSESQTKLGRYMSVHKRTPSRMGIMSFWSTTAIFSSSAK